MFNVDFLKIDRFFKCYRSFASSGKIGVKHIHEACEVIKFSKNCEIIFFSSLNPLNVEKFLFVPSIFNSVEILFINSGTHFIENLRLLGDVYLIKWIQIDDSDFNIDSYTFEAGRVVDYINRMTKANINLVGHCIGGNIALAAGIFKKNTIKTLSLLTTPWDFSHFKIAYEFHKNFNLDEKITLASVAPAIYTKILFFLLEPDFFNLKIDKYFNLTNVQCRHLFMEVEHWLMSGISIPKSAYFQIINQLMCKNILAKNQWVINDITINHENFDKPVFILIAKNDRLAPKSSILPLFEGLKNVKLIELRGGHINYMVGSQIKEFFKQYNNWLKGEI